MAATRKPDFDKVRAAYKETAKFDTWVREVLLPAMDGKVEYKDAGFAIDRTYHFNQYAAPRIIPTKTGIRITFISPGYGHNETDTYIGTVDLTWSEMNALVPTARKAAKR